MLPGTGLRIISLDEFLENPLTKVLEESLKALLVGGEFFKWYLKSSWKSMYSSVSVAVFGGILVKFSKEILGGIYIKSQKKPLNNYWWYSWKIS